MSFTVHFITTDSQRKGWLVGESILGEAKERFRSSLDYWTQDDYRTQWIDGIKRLLDSQHSSSLLCTDFSLASNSMIDLWAFYKDGQEVRVQNFLIESTAIGHYSALKDLYGLIPQYEKTASEWQLSLEDIAVWLENNT